MTMSRLSYTVNAITDDDPTMHMKIMTYAFMMHVDDLMVGAWLMEHS